MQETVLELKNYSVSFDTPDGEVQAVRNVDLTVKKGEILCIVGESGCGKTVMCRSVMKLLPPNAHVKSGEISLCGENITAYKRKKMEKLCGSKVSMVFQDPMTGTAATMSIEENMAIAARRGQKRGLGWGVTKKEREHYREALKELDLGLEDRLSSKVGLLSGGQRQAITLLMASLKKPKLLLLDEHTAALDPKTAAKVLALSDKIISENNLTAMMVTHNMKDAIAHGNRLIMMHEGKVIYDVSGEEKKNLKVSDLLAKFEEVSGGEFANDRMMLS